MFLDIQSEQQSSLKQSLMKGALLSLQTAAHS
jgi:hypothetical protein